MKNYIRTAISIGLLLAVSSAACADAPHSIPAPNIPSRVFKITDYGAIGDGSTLDSKAVQGAIDACLAARGGVVDVPAGRYLTGPITLGSHIDLRLERGATLLMTDDASAYTLVDNRYQNEISCDGCTDIAVTGDGTIDGQGRTWWARFKAQQSAPAGSPKPQHRPYLVVISSCRRVLVQGVTLTDSPSFHLVPGHCDDVRIDHVTIKAPADAPNTDGIDPSGWNFLIENCTIDVGDDNIAVKPSGSPPPGESSTVTNGSSEANPSCKNFLIRNCTFLHGHGMSIGGQTPGGLDGLTVSDCTFDDTVSGIRLKAARGAGGVVQNLTYERLTMTGVRNPIDISSYYYSLPARGASTDTPQPATATTPTWRDIHISDVTATGADTDITVLGLPEAPVAGLTLTNVDLSGKHAGQIVHVNGLTFADCTLSSTDGPPSLNDVTRQIGVPKYEQLDTPTP